MSDVGIDAADVHAVVERLRRELVELHHELPRNGLVVWTAGNVSARIPATDLFLIKPSGVTFDELTPESMVLCHLDGSVVEGSVGSESISMVCSRLCSHTVRTRSPRAVPTRMVTGIRKTSGVV